MHRAGSEDKDPSMNPAKPHQHKFTRRQTNAKQRHHVLVRFNSQSPISSVHASPFIPDLTIWLQKHTEYLVIVLMICITMLFPKAINHTKGALWASLTIPCTNHAGWRTSQTDAAVWSGGKRASSLLQGSTADWQSPIQRTRGDPKLTSFGESCVHMWKVNSKTLKPACSIKTHKNSSIIQPPGKRQRC